MLVLFETPAGYAIFKLLDEKKIKSTDNLYQDFETPEGASKVVKLKHFEKFLDTTEALAATTAAVEGKLSKTLKKALKKMVSKEVQDKLLVADAKLGNVIKDKLNLQCVSNTAVNELIRCIRSQSESLLSGLSKKDMTAMALGLAHSLSRYKLKFSPDKVDTMIIQAICLLDELDKELNNYTMRCREWYGWHFPELGKIITDNVVFVKTIKLVADTTPEMLEMNLNSSLTAKGTRENICNTDLSDLLPEDIEAKVREVAEISMGTEISDEDTQNILKLCDQVIEISSYRTQLYDYLRSRMMAIAPNVTVLLGELIGARLISHAGSLVNLAKHPASTVQILGAEKALFRALKTKKDTPKFGLIYHSQLVAQASIKMKGKASRMLATKASLAIRFDALGDDSSGMELGAAHKAKLEERLRILEDGNLKKISGTAKAKAIFQKYHSKSEVLQYSAADDSTLPSGKRKFEDKKPLIEEIASGSDLLSPPKKKKKLEADIKVEVKSEMEDEAGEGPKKKKKKKKIKQEPEEQDQTIEESYSLEDDSISKKKKKKKVKEEKMEETEEVVEDVTLKDDSISKKKKKKKVKEEKMEETEEVVEDVTLKDSGKKKKKKSKKEVED